MNNINIIQEKIDLITRSLEWIKEYKNESYQQKFLRLVPLRCELRKMMLAKEENPAIAAYGESQKGKSYLMGNLLQKNGNPFMVRCDGKEYDFVAQINPIGDKREATGVVTRFTSYLGHEDRVSEKYPARMKVMSVANIVTILLDGYFNDILDDQRYSDKDIQDKADKIYDKYINREPIQNEITEDDIIDIKLYLQRFVNRSKVSAFCDNTDFFNKIALVIRHIPLNECVNVFSILWHDNKDLTELFIRLLRCLQKMKFAKVIYLPIEAVLHEGMNKNTIMSVECLNGLYSNNELPLYSDIYVKNEDGFERLTNFDKSELSALCLEVSFKVDVEYLDDKAEYYFDENNAGKAGFMSKSVYAKLTQDGKYISKRRLLEVSDLLDFPGAKNREQMKEETLNRTDEETQQSNLVKLFLRGKVSFLFNHFSDSKVINILMFCHNAEDVKVTQMYNVINEWIKTYVGDTVEKRKKTIQLAGNIAPFFAIGTMFNIDMTKKGNPAANSDASLQERWKGRFSKVMYQDCFHAGTDVDWFKNWSDKGVYFDNVFILRDFKYSGCNGQGNNLYEGYDEDSGNLRETKLALPEDYYERLTRSFITDTNNVGRFFSDPEVTWETTATMNNDGSLYIIQKLCTVAIKMRDVRESQFHSRISEISNEAYSIVKDFYQKDNDDGKLEYHFDRAIDVLSEFDTDSNNSFFGKLIDMLQISEKEAYVRVHEIIESPQLIEDTHTVPPHEQVIKRLPQCNSEDEVLEHFANVYHKESKEKAKEYLNSKDIDPKDLITGNKVGKRTISYLISDFVLQYWKEKIGSAAFLSMITSNSKFDMGVMSDLISNIFDMIEVSDLVNKMSESISDVVNVVAIGTANEFYVADVLRHMINTFVTDLGVSLLDDSKTIEIKNVAELLNVPVRGYIDRHEKTEFNEEELTDMFSKLAANSEGITPSYDKHYHQWLEYMFLSYIATAGKITKIENKAANDKIGNIISKLNEAV